jgi:thymidylate synthase
MKQYLDELQYILDHGILRSDRTGTGTLSVFGRQMRFDLQAGFPLVTTKKMLWGSIVSELLWFLEGSTDERRLAEIRYEKPRQELEGKTTIWTANAQAEYWKYRAKYDGDLGAIYSKQWRRWRNNFGQDIDQIQTLIDGIKKDPSSRRHIVVAYNPGELNQMALPPCHAMFQMYVADGKLSCMMTQRSSDWLLGIPYNIASYSLLTHMVAQVCELEVGEFILSSADSHIYTSHIEQVREQLTRETYPLPKLWFNPEIKNIDDFKMCDIKILDYQSHPAISAPMAV